MAQPFIATNRIHWQYIIGGLTHDAHLFCKGVGGALGSRTLTYRDASVVPVQTAVNVLAAAWSQLMPTGYSFGDFRLENKVGVAWVLLETFTPTFTDASSGSSAVASQATLVLRDTHPYPIKVVVLEGNVNPPSHFVSEPAITPSQLRNFVDLFTHFGVNPNRPFEWVVSRDENYISPSGDLVGVTMTLNRRVRRDRGLA